MKGGEKGKKSLWQPAQNFQLNTRPVSLEPQGNKEGLAEKILNGGETFGYQKGERKKNSTPTEKCQLFSSDSTSDLGVS